MWAAALLRTLFVILYFAYSGRRPFDVHETNGTGNLASLSIIFMHSKHLLLRLSITAVLCIPLNPAQQFPGYLREDLLSNQFDLFFFKDIWFQSISGTWDSR